MDTSYHIIVWKCWIQSQSVNFIIEDAFFRVLVVFLVRGATFNQATPSEFDGAKVLLVGPSSLTKRRRRHISISRKKNRIYLFKGFSPPIFTSALPFACFVLVLREEWTEIIIPFRRKGNEWRKHHSVEIRLIFFFIRISTIYRLIYLLSRYESLHFPFRSLSHLQLFRIGALSPIWCAPWCQRPKIPTRMIDSYIYNELLCFRFTSERKVTSVHHLLRVGYLFVVVFWLADGPNAMNCNDVMVMRYTTRPYTIEII